MAAAVAATAVAIAVAMAEAATAVAAATMAAAAEAAIIAEAVMKMKGCERVSERFNGNGEWLSRFAGIRRESSGDDLKGEQIPLCLRGEI